MQKESANSSVQQERQMLREAHAKGTAATLGTYVRLSGPGWLQSAITLGGGSLAGALFLGALGGVSMLWLQLMAIIMGVIMLSAISYVTLSTGERPFTAINQHINPALGWGWLVATSMANMIWCMPQFSLSFTALEKNLLPGVIGSSDGWKFGVSLVLLAAVSVVVALNAQRGLAAKIFDWLLKGLVAMVVLCFFGVVVYLASRGVLDWGAILAGYIPDLSQWTEPAGKTAEAYAAMPSESQEFWGDKLMRAQRAKMIAAMATAVGINMTFLLPYSMLHRGWDKPFRGLARFDLMTGMAIPYVLVTSCVVIAAAYAFHDANDEAYMSTDPDQFASSEAVQSGAAKSLYVRAFPDAEAKTLDEAVKAVTTADMTDEEKAAAVRPIMAKIAALPADEKQVAAAMLQRDASTLAKTLSPLIGDRFANLVFGLGVFGMGFSTIIILMLINGFVFCEAVGKPDSKTAYFVGCMVAGVVGAMWPMVWSGESRFWFTVLASTFGAMLLPIAYVTFFMMMNSKSLMGKEKPQGASLIAWNVLMAISCLGAIVWAATAIYDKATNTSSPQDIQAGRVVIGLVVVYAILVIAGFFIKPKANADSSAAS